MDPTEISHQIYDVLAAQTAVTPPRIRTWGGDTWGPIDASATLVLRHPGALRSMLLPLSDLSAGEAYIYDDVDIEGDIISVLDFALSIDDSPPSPRAAVKLYRLLRQLPKGSAGSRSRRPRLSGARHSLRRDRAAISRHYDTGNEFFRQFLDPALVYSSAVFLSPIDTLEAAQRRKLDLICRKLDLGPGKRFLDVGCGWGALAVHAASEYGATAVGVTLSAGQADYAKILAKEHGVEDRVTIEQRDYREVDGSFEAIASVGMVEHVGADQLAIYFDHLRDLLTPDGVLLNHGIVHAGDQGRQKRSSRKGAGFMDTYVFPDGEVERLGVVVDAAEGAGLEVRDVESLRTSYALTLRHWVANLESNHDAAVSAASEEAYRIWRAYMAGAAVAFETGRLSVYQLVLSNPGSPWVFGRSTLLASDDT